MGELRLYAIGVDEVRDVFGGGAEAADDLRAVLTTTFPPTTRPSKGLLGSLGPLLKRPPDAPVIRPDWPNDGDIAAITAGHYLPPERLTAAWRLLEAWLAERSWGAHTLTASEHDLSAVDFDLACAGVASQFSLSSLINGELRLPLMPLPGMATGYIRHDRAHAMASSWRQALGTLAARSAPIARPLSAWLDRLPSFAAAAETTGRPRPDVIGCYHGI